MDAAGVDAAAVEPPPPWKPPPPWPAARTFAGAAARASKAAKATGRQAVRMERNMFISFRVRG